MRLSKKTGPSEEVTGVLRNGYFVTVTLWQQTGDERQLILIENRGEK